MKCSCGHEFEPVIQYRHRLAVGDCTDEAVVEAVMRGERASLTVTDPPYNALRSWGKDEAKSETRLDPSTWFLNDNMEWDEYWAFIETAFRSLQGHSVYVCCDYRIYPGMANAVRDAGYSVKHCIVWKKNVWGLGWRYRFQHEFLIYACQEDDAPFYGGRDQSDVWEVPHEKTVDHHTPKPVALFEKAIKNSSEQADVVFDGFVGHGTTIIACERLNRKCRAIEIDPGYCAVAIQRWADLTHGEPRLLG